MPQITMQDVRAKYPQYNDMSDQQLADALHARYYSDVPKGDFYSRIGFDGTDIFGDTGFDQPRQPKPVSRIPGAATLRDNLQDVASENTGIPVVGPAIRGAAMLGAGVADMGARPVDATLEGMQQVITSPRRTIEGVGRSSEALMQGKPVQAVNEALGAGTAAMEFGLAAGAPFASPVASKAAQVAKPAATGAEAAFARAGVDPSIAALSDSQAVKGMTKTISENFIGGRGVRNNTEKQLKQLEGATQKQIDDLGAASPYEAGEIAIEGVKLFDKNAGKLYKEFERATDMNAVANLDNTIQAIRAERSRFSNEELQRLFEPKMAEKVQAIIDPVGRTQADELFDAVMDLKRSAPREKEASLVDLVVKAGGIKDDRGDVLQMIGGTVRGRPGVINKNGKQIDEIIEMATEDGYFPGHNIDQGILPTRSEFLDALDSEFRSGRKYVGADEYDAAVTDMFRRGIDPTANKDDLIAQIEAATGQKVTGSSGGTGELSISDIRQLRTEVRRAAREPSLKKTQDDVLLERLEGALTQDLYNAVGATSGKDALSKMKRADTYYRGTKKRLETVLKPFVDERKPPEQAFRNIMTAMQQTGSRSGTGNFQRIRKLKNTLTPEQTKEVAGGIMKAATRKEEGGDFNLNAFVTNWNRMGPDQKNIMFGHPGTKSRDALDDLFTVADKLKSVEDMANFSRSGVTAQNFGTVYGFGAAPITTSAVLLGEAAIGRLLTNPRYVRIVRNQMNAEYQVARLRRLGNETMANAMLERQKTRTLTALSAIQGTDPSVTPLIEALNDNTPQQEQSVRTPLQP